MADIIVVGILALMTIWGFRRGLVQSLIRMLSFVISIALIWIAYPYISTFFGDNIFVNLLIILAIFIACMILLRILARVLKIFTDLPIIKQINALGGGIFGLLQGALLIYLVFALLYLVNPMIENDVVNHVFAVPEQFYTIQEAIQNSSVASVMYNNNWLLNMFNFWF